MVSGTSMGLPLVCGCEWGYLSSLAPTSLISAPQPHPKASLCVLGLWSISSLLTFLCPSLWGSQRAPLAPTQHGTLPPWSPLPASASWKDRLLLSDNQATCFSHAGHAPHHFKLVSVHVFIRHGDRYPLYAIPKTKRPEIDCTLVANR